MNKINTVVRSWDIESGEVFLDTTLNPNERLKIVRDSTKEQYEYLKNKRAMGAMTQSLQGFV